VTPVLAPPSVPVAAEAADRLAALATPAGALGRLGALAVWWSAVSGACPPPVPQRVRAVVFAGDHGVAAHGVSAYPAAVTPAMVDLLRAGRATASALAAAHDVDLRVLDVAVGRPSAPIHLADAVSPAEAEEALALGLREAAADAAAGAQLLVVGEVGIGNTTPAAALVSALLGRPAAEVTGRGTGVDDEGLARKVAVVAGAVERVGERAQDPVEALAALGGADLAAMTGYVAGAARAGVPVLLDGVVTLAATLVAERLEPGVVACCAAGHRSTEPAAAAALDALGLEPLLDLGMGLGEGTGALAAVPLVRSAAVLLRDVALLADVLP
jgi:nicotinate-nucleotide--dimethylbenzimidazole phosphoribosyltransferase